MIRLFSRSFCLTQHKVTFNESCMFYQNMISIRKFRLPNHTFRQSYREITKLGNSNWIWKDSLNPRPLLISVFHRNFHVSQRKHIHPIFWMLIKPIGKIASIITGRTLRKWWQALPHAEKSKVKENLIYHRLKIAALVALFVALGFANVATHMQEAPITKRRRYIAFTEDQFMKIAKYELENQWETLKNDVIDPNDPKARKIYGKIVAVAQKIIDSNQHIDLLKRQKWNVILINRDEANAFVLPTGQIFVFKGILELTNNLDQLAVVLGHEIAHVILNHGAEKVSVAGLIDVIVILVMAGIWFFMPTDGIAIVTQWFYNKVMTLLLHLPYSRKLEAEADDVGLQLIARACFDVREATSFWQKMALNEELVANGEIPAPEWTSTHPSSDTRAAILNDLIPQAIDLRKTCHCSRLPLVDPRAQFKWLKELAKNQTDDVTITTEGVPHRAEATPGTATAAIVAVRSATVPVGSATVHARSATVSASSGTVPARSVTFPAQSLIQPDQLVFVKPRPEAGATSTAAEITAKKS